MIEWAARRPAVVLAASVAVFLGGVVASTRLALASRTSVELPRLQVRAEWPGAAAEQVEMYITSPIEAAVHGLRGVRRTRSESRDASAFVLAELEPHVDVQLTRLSILERLEFLRNGFPAGSRRPAVSNYVPEELEERPLLMVTISGPHTAGTLQRIADERLVPKLSAVPGVAGIAVQGGTELGISVTYDSRRLRHAGVSPDRIADALADARRTQSLGVDRSGRVERPVVLRDQPESIAQLRHLPIEGPAGHLFRLGDLASVRSEEDARGRFFRIDGQPALALSIARMGEADAIKTTAALRSALDELDRGGALPAGVKLLVAGDMSRELKERVRDLVVRSGIAFGAVMLLLPFALRGIRAVALVMGSTAVAVAGTALVLYILRIPTNLLTLAGLGMGIGVLVQNALIIVERLARVSDTRQGRAQAARRMVPAIAGATLSTAVVLLPFLYLQGDARAAFVPFAVAFGLALGWSMLAALVMIPALGAGHGLRARSWPRARYLYCALVMYVLRRRLSVLVITVLATAGLTWGFVTRVPRLAWSGDRQQRTTVGVTLTFPRGSDPAALDAAMRDFESVAVGFPGVEQVLTQSRGPAAAMMRATFRRAEGLMEYPFQLEEQLTLRAALIGGANASVHGQGPGFFSASVSVRTSSFGIKVLGYSYAGVERLALDLKERLERIPRVRDVQISGGGTLGQPNGHTVTIEPDRDVLARFGVTATEFTRAMAREIRGPIGRQLIEIGGDELPVTVKAMGAYERSLGELRNALVPTPSGNPVRIGDLSTIGEREALAAVAREDQQYVRVVSYDFRGSAKLAQRTHDAFMQAVTVPPGYGASDASVAWEKPDGSERGLWLVFGLGVVLVVLAIAAVFNSVWAAVVGFLSLPIALGGVMGAFWVGDAVFTREAAVGVILVLGLAVNQAILLIDAALERRRRNAGRGVGVLTAPQVLRAALDRAGIIVLVTLSTLVSLVPLAVWTTADSLFGAIALATAGGTMAGTVGAMLVLPAILVGRVPTRGHT